MKADQLAVLLTISRGPRHGYAILREAAELSNGAVRLQPGALYRLLKRLLDDGLTEEAAAQQADRDDERRRYYRLTVAGLLALKLAAQRLEALNRTVQLVRHGRSVGPS